MKHKIPSHVAWVMDRLASCGHEAYCVGGCVRDTLLGLIPHDWDVCTGAAPSRVMECFRGGRVIETGLRHGTVTVVIEGKPVEVTTYRVDGAYSDHRRPDEVVFTGSLAEDLARRDFTINAMVMARNGEILDFLGGRDDLQNGLLRCVGNPAARFEEDALRILRALRFASRFALAIEAGTADALLEKRELLQYVAAERALSELSGTRFERVDARFLPALQVVIPELTGLAIPHGLPHVPVLQLAALLQGLDARAILTRLKASRAMTERVSLLAARMGGPIEADDIAIRRLLRDMGPEAAEQLLILQKNEMALQTLRRVLGRGDCYTLAALAVRGDDLTSLGLEGKAIGEALERLLDKVIGGELPNERGRLLRYLHQGE